MNKTGRIIEFDIIKCLAIFLVLWGHAIQHLSNMGGENTAYRIIYFFHMPLFMLVSGFFSLKVMEVPFLEIIKKKAKQLLYPTLSFGLLLLGVSFLISFIETHHLQVSIKESVNYLWGLFWFLKCLFVCFVVLKLCLMAFKNKIMAIVIAILISQCLPLFKVNWMMPFFAVGFLLNLYLPLMIKQKRKIVLVSVTMFVVLVVLLYDQSKQWTQKMAGLKEGFLTGNFSALGDYALMQGERFLIGFFGAMAIISGIFALPERIKNNKMFVYLKGMGAETLGIYIIQTLILESLLSRALDFSEMNVFLFSYLLCPVISALTMYLCYKLSGFINKTPWLKRIFYLKPSTNKKK